ncbi:MAG: glycerophosphodiester phosphodiesterase family protein [Gramella sp.]|nr:glycerophosphodiester phosphodiesterase family protein [Christiangramia sp.]
MIKTSLYIFALMLILTFTLFTGRDFILPESNVLYTSEDRVMVAAHRGIHKNHPENSIPSINEAIYKGVDIVEIDIRISRDNIPVLMHDKSLQRTTGHNHLVEKLTFKELQKFNLLFRGEPTGYKIPSLEEVLKFTKGRIILNLDLKIDDLEAMKTAYKLISKHQMEKEIIFTVNDLKVIPELYNQNPEIRIMPVAFSWRKINKVLDHDFLNIIQLYHRPYSERTIKKIEGREMEIWVNSLDKFDKLETEAKDGFEKLLYIKKVDVIQTDHPEELLDFLRKKGLHP